MSPKETILKRRARFVAAALTSAGLAGCGDGPTNPGSHAADSGVVDGAKDSVATDSGLEDTPTVCLSAPFDSGSPDTGSPDTEPTVCLSAPFDSGTADTFDATVDAADTGPVPCLVPPPG